MKKYQVISNKFHGENFLSSHSSFLSALKSLVAHDCAKCTCGGPRIADDDGDYLIAISFYRSQDYMTLREAIIQVAKDKKEGKKELTHSNPR